MSTEQVLQGLTNESRTLLEGYLKWSKDRRDKFSQDLEFDARSFSSGRLLDSTFSKHEVEELLQQQLLVVKNSVEGQDHHKSLTIGSFVHAVLAKADLHRIPLDVNALEALGNVQVSTGLESVEQRLLSGPKSKLQPLTAVETGGDAGKQLADANDQIKHLHAKVMMLTAQHAQATTEKSNLHEQIHALQAQLSSQQGQVDAYGQQIAAQEGADMATVTALRQEITQLTLDMNGKLSQSSQFQGLKRMLLEKNDALRTLRQQLASYDPAFAASGSYGGGGDDILIEEDDD